MRSEAVERRVVALGVCPLLLSILDSPHWPNCLRDVAGGLLQSLAERWDNVLAMPGLRYIIQGVYESVNCCLNCLLVEHVSAYGAVQWGVGYTG